ncbi:hypothetical protein P4O66_003088 [Electrophorus voltai]|uniref:Uncharacterized protein n=1 Tax=Electrophorus voltai TaxID=2609070 RepID=A0AAD8YVW4_9TELE|nr:hypothetical protein P4O66_003088 [Electrophorus voltai]
MSAAYTENSSTLEDTAGHSRPPPLAAVLSSPGTVTQHRSSASVLQPQRSNKHRLSSWPASEAHEVTVAKTFKFIRKAKKHQTHPCDYYCS